MNNVNLYNYLGVPVEFGLLPFGIILILCLVPYFGGTDFGIVKIPDFAPVTNRKLKILGPFIMGAFLLISFFPLFPKEKPTLLQWSDEFQDGELNVNRWVKPTDSNLIFESEGVLNFVAAFSEDSQSANTIALPQGLPVQEVTFTITLVAYEAGQPGGAGVSLVLNDGSLMSVDVGPGPEGAGAELSTCPSSDASYIDCAHREGPDFRLGDSVPIRLTWSDGYVDFYIGGSLYSREDAASQPVGVRFYMFADPGSVFHTTVDDVHIVFVTD